MDAIIRPIDAARFERERRAELDAEAPSTVADTSGIGLTDTVVFNPPVVTLDEAHRERERILPPGAAGKAGVPYKMLRTQVLRRLAELSANSLVVLSAASGEGKTLTAINLAIAIAAHPGHTALLVDLDLRNPTMHKRLNLQPRVGVEEVVERRGPVYEAMFKLAGYERLTVLAAREPVAQSSELLASQRMGELVLELRNRYLNRVIIFDVPPVLQADDALAFSHHVQAGLFVVSEGRSAREAVTRSIKLLHRLPILGTVLNRSEETIGGYY